MSLFIELLFSRVFSYGIQLYRILILMYHMSVSSIYSKISCYLMIFPFDMTNEITTVVLYLCISTLLSLSIHACVSSRGAQSTELVSLYIGYWTLNNYYYYYYY